MYDTNKPEWNIEELENAGFIIVEIIAVGTG